MVATGCLRPAEVCEAVQWDVIFLLAGIVPLGIALETTGAADFLADLLVLSAESLRLLGVLGLFYLVTALLTNVIGTTRASC